MPTGPAVCRNSTRRHRPGAPRRSASATTPLGGRASPLHEYGAVPNPAVFLSHLAAQTQRLRLGTAISILTFHHPATVAENYAMVDALSGGRLLAGRGLRLPEARVRRLRRRPRHQARAL
ncbi:LLM class flavin-dependent oxidoreductase [Cupriavidus basilensis]